MSNKCLISILAYAVRTGLSLANTKQQKTFIQQIISNNSLWDDFYPAELK